MKNTSPLMYAFLCSFVTVYQAADPEQPVLDLPQLSA